MNFGRALENEAEYHALTYALALKKGWDFNDTSLFNKEDKKFTSDGYISYWNAVDKTIWFCDTLLMKKEMRKKEKQNKEKDAHMHRDKYHWSRNEYHR